MGVVGHIAAKVLEKAGAMVAEKATEVAVTKAVEYIDKKNEANSLTERANSEKINADYLAQEHISTKSFFEDFATIHRLTINERVIALRKSYDITDKLGNVVYTAKRIGLPKFPKIGLYDVDSNKLGSAEKSFLGNPAYTLNYNGKTIASLYQEVAFKTKFAIPENGWRTEGSFSKTIVYDNVGNIAAQIQYMLSTDRNAVIIEYSNKNNEIPIVLIALAIMLGYHNG